MSAQSSGFRDGVSHRAAQSSGSAQGSASGPRTTSKSASTTLGGFAMPPFYDHAPRLASADPSPPDSGPFILALSEDGGDVLGDGAGDLIGQPETTNDAE
jgi:hypothetical protein